MNIFVIGEQACPYLSARDQCDKHVVKMPTESGQMLSTVHRILDGKETRRLSKSGKTMSKYWELPDEREEILYKAVHPNHPSTLWTMESDANYRWHWEHLYALCKEYTSRYGKVHSVETRLLSKLKTPPQNIPIGPMTQFKLAMKANPECMFPDDPVKSYRMFYHTKQDRFKMTWRDKSPPSWFVTKVS
jgi:hypothetical protein